VRKRYEYAVATGTTISELERSLDGLADSGYRAVGSVFKAWDDEIPTYAVLMELEIEELT